MASASSAAGERNTSRNRSLPEEEWETMKTRFKQLYITEDKTMRVCEAIMKQEYQTQATHDQWVKRAKHWGFHKNNTKNNSPARISQTKAQDELRKQLSPSQSDGASAHYQPTSSIHKTAPHTSNTRSDYSRTENLSQTLPPLQYEPNASQANNELPWSYVGTSDHELEQHLYAPGPMYTGPYADNQLTTESFHTEPTFLTIPHAASQKVFQVPHVSNLETPGAMFQPGLHFAHNRAELGPAGTSVEMHHERQGLVPICHPPLLPSHHYTDEYDEENGDDGDDNGTGRRQ